MFNSRQRPGLRLRGACVETVGGNATEGDGRGESRDRRPDAGYGRPEARRRTRTHDPPTSRAVGTFDVCSNAAVNSGRSCLLYRGRLKQPHLHCRAEAVV